MWDIVGHEQAVAQLARSLRIGRVAHAYLITGPARVGKTTLGLRLAQALNCEAPEPPCGQCRSCRRIAAGLNTDVRTLQLVASPEAEDGGEARERPRTGAKNIRLQQVNDLLHEVMLSRQEGKYKVYTILDAENLSHDSANRLLKVLEEPPAGVVLLLTAADANILLPTIVSRCQVIRLQPVPTEKIASYLRERLGLEAGRAAVLARLAAGRVGWAIAAASDESEVSERAEALGRLVGLVDAGLGDRFAVAARMATEFGRERASVYRALDLWTIWWRDLLFVHLGEEDATVNVDRGDDLRAQARAFSTRAIHEYLTRIETARAQLEQNVNPRLALEALFLAIPRAGAT